MPIYPRAFIVDVNLYVAASLVKHFWCISRIISTHFKPPLYYKRGWWITCDRLFRPPYS